MYSIDLNCDAGESFGCYNIGNDEKLLDYVTSVNIACGFHAGDPMVMEKTIKMAVKKGVAIGAHPGYPDLLGFGRREMKLSTEEIKSYIIYQLGALAAFAKAAGGRLWHVKPHGAMYNSAAKDFKLARAIAEAVYTFDDSLVFVGLSGSMMLEAAKETGLKTAQEVFADRAYEDDGTLVPRSKEGTMIEDADICVKRMVRVIKEGKITTINNNEINLHGDTICLHGDSAKAIDFAVKINSELKKEKIILANIGKILECD